MWSTLQQVVPRLEWQHSSAPDVTHHLFKHPHVEHHGLNQVTCAFFRVNGAHWHYSFANLFILARNFLHLLDEAQSSHTIRARLQRLISHRNCLQHSILSLGRRARCISRSQRELQCQPGNISSCWNCMIHELVRLSLNVLSTLAVFPISGVPELYSRQNSALLKQLSVCSTQIKYMASAGNALELLTWASMLGAANCLQSQTAQRAEFVAKLAGYTRRLGLAPTSKSMPQDPDHWQKLRAILHEFLWCDAELENIGAGVWHDVFWMREERSTVKICGPRSFQGTFRQ